MHNLVLQQYAPVASPSHLSVLFSPGVHICKFVIRNASVSNQNADVFGAVESASEGIGPCREDKRRQISLQWTDTAQSGEPAQACA